MVDKKKTPSPNGAVLPPDVVAPSNDDIQLMLAQNPLAKAQLEAIYWRRLALTSPTLKPALVPASDN